MRARCLTLNNLRLTFAALWAAGGRAFFLAVSAFFPILFAFAVPVNSPDIW